LQFGLAIDPCRFLNPPAPHLFFPFLFQPGRGSVCCSWESCFFFALSFKKETCPPRSYLRYLSNSRPLGTLNATLILNFSAFPPRLYTFPFLSPLTTLPKLLSLRSHFTNEVSTLYKLSHYSPARPQFFYNVSGLCQSTDFTAFLPGRHPVVLFLRVYKLGRTLKLLSGQFGLPWPCWLFLAFLVFIHTYHAPSTTGLGCGPPFGEAFFLAPSP